MCGRFTLTAQDLGEVARAFEATLRAEDAAEYRPRYNTAPTDRVWIVCLSDDERRIVPAKWGLPASGRGDDPGLINARSETVDRRPAFREAFRSHRCVVAADGFYEWTGPKSDRRPLWFHRPDRSPFGLAGIYRDVVTTETGEVSHRVAILTCDANRIVAPHHDRMPVVLPLPATQSWLQGPDAPDFAALMEPIDADFLVADPVSKRVNDPHHDEPGCIEPVEDPHQRSLF